MAVKPVPEGYHTLTPYLVMKNAARAIEFYKKAFGASEVLRIPAPDGGVAHAEVKIGDSILMLADEHPDMGFVGPETLGGSAVSLMIYLEGVDDVFKRAIESGARELRPVQDQFYGDRSGTLTDPFGHVWTIATHVEDVSEEELQRRMQEMEKG